MRRLTSLGIFLAALFIVQSASAEEWSRFRGPNGSGVSAIQTVPTQWEKKDHKWERKLPGKAHASPVVWGDKVFVTSADSEKQLRYLHCVSAADGTILWTREFPFQTFKKHKTNTFASNTPAVDQNHVYVLWQSRNGSELVAITHSGDNAWSLDMGKYKSGHGTGSSPIAYQGKVIVCNDHDGTSSFLLAVSARDGKVAWKIPRISDRACYSTPCIFQPKDEPAQVIFTHSFRGIWGVGFESGDVLWKRDVFGTHKQRAVGSPVVVEDLVIGSSGFTTAEKNVVILKPTRRAENWEAPEVYRLSKSVPHVPTPLVYDQRLYLLSDTGIVTCADVTTGKKIWQKRIGGSFFSSPICIHGHLYCADRDGRITVLKCGDTYQRVGKIDIGEEIRATPAVGKSKLFIRTTERLIAVGG